MTAPKYGHGGDVWSFFRDSGRSVEEVADFSANINPLGFPGELTGILQDAIPEIIYYPEPRAAALREGLARCYGVHPEEVIVGNGAAELIFLYCRAAGSELLAYVPAPTFSEYALAAAAAGGRVEHLQLEKEDNCAIDPLKMLSLIARKKNNQKKAVFFLCNPNNPTGLHIEAEKLPGFNSELNERGVELFVDLSFWGFAPDGLGGEHALPCFPVKELAPLGEEGQTLTEENDRPPILGPFFLFSFTKFFALPGLRLGYGIGPRPLISAMERQREPWSVNLLAQKAGLHCMEAKEYAARTLKLVQEERDYLLSGLDKIDGIEAFPSTANFLLCSLHKSGVSAKELTGRLKKEGILVRDASNFPGLDRYYIRLAVRSRPENELLLEKLQEALAE